MSAEQMVLAIGLLVVAFVVAATRYLVSKAQANVTGPQLCPFCRECPEVLGGLAPADAFVHCLKCQLFGPTRATRAEAIAAWNSIEVVR